MNSIFTKKIFNFGIFNFKITIFMMQFVKHVLRVTLIELIVSLTVDRLAFPVNFLYFYFLDLGFVSLFLEIC